MELKNVEQHWIGCLKIVLNGTYKRRATLDWMSKNSLALIELAFLEM